MNWADVERALEKFSGTMVLPKGEIVTPTDAGARKSVGLPAGQYSDWRFPPRPDGRGLHVHEYPDRYEAHLDAVHPQVSTVRHWVRDTPKLFWAAVTGVLGAVTWKIWK